MNKTSKFYKPGRDILKRCRDARVISPNHPAITLSLLPLLGLTGIWFKLCPTFWPTTIFVVLLFVQTISAYLMGAEKSLDVKDREDVWYLVTTLKSLAAGNVGAVLDSFWKRHRTQIHERLTPEAYRSELESRQQQLLAHACMVLNQKIGNDSDDPKLVSNWCVRGSGDEFNNFRAVVYDRNLVKRKPDPSDWKPIQADRPGASEAFLTGNISVVDDVSQFGDVFDLNKTYKSILSIPVVVGKNVFGVMNIDAEKPHTLRVEYGELVLDIAFLIGFCEVLKRETIDKDDSDVSKIH